MAAPKYLGAARDFGRLLGAAGHRLVYGGGNCGMMGAVADGALEHGAEVIGVIPRMFDEYEVAHQGLTRLEYTLTMHERKARMVELCDVFVALPGGLGTWDELCEILTWRQLRFHSKPVLIVNQDGFYDALLALADRAVEEGMLREENRALFDTVASVEEAAARIEAI